MIRFTSVKTGCVVKPKAIQCRDAPYVGKQEPDLPRSLVRTCSTVSFNTSPQMAAQWNSFFTAISSLGLPNFVTHLGLRAINPTKFCRFAVPKNDDKSTLLRH